MPACRMMILAVTWQVCRILWRNTNLWKPTSLLTRLVHIIDVYHLFWSGFYWRFILGWVWFPIAQQISVRKDRESIAGFPALVVGRAYLSCVLIGLFSCSRHVWPSLLLCGFWSGRTIEYCSSQYSLENFFVRYIILHVTEMLFLSIFKDRITDLQAQTQHFAEVGHFDADSLQDKSRGIAERYEK